VRENKLKQAEISRNITSRTGPKIKGTVYPAYNLYFLACFLSQNSVFLSQQISQQCFSTGLSVQGQSGSSFPSPSEI
jgi:hypothetical protein